MTLCCSVDIDVKAVSANSRRGRDQMRLKAMAPPAVTEAAKELPPRSQRQHGATAPSQKELFDSSNHMNIDPAGLSIHGAVAKPGTVKTKGKRRITEARRERNRKAQTRYREKCKV